MKFTGTGDLFLSTPSARRATESWPTRSLSFGNFYPRPPRGGRRCAPVLSRELAHISIHALREEGDDAASGPCKGFWDFYPRPPRGGRLAASVAVNASVTFLSTPSARRATCVSTRADCAALFLSTPSARRATPGRRLSAQYQHISIHALREEGDAQKVNRPCSTR